jgi:hypothetical protein
MRENMGPKIKKKVYEKEERSGIYSPHFIPI